MRPVQCHLNSVFITTYCDKRVTSGKMMELKEFSLCFPCWYQCKRDIRGHDKNLNLLHGISFSGLKYLYQITLSKRADYQKKSAEEIQFVTANEKMMKEIN